MPGRNSKAWRGGQEMRERKPHKRRCESVQGGLCRRDNRSLRLAVENIAIDDGKRQQSLCRIRREAGEKKRISNPSFVHRVVVQLRYLERGYDMLPILLIVGALCLIYGMRQDGTKEMELLMGISAVTALLGIFGAVSISRLFSHHMGELEAVCFCSLGELVAMHMMLSAVRNGALLLLCSIFMTGWLQLEFIRILLYILTPFLVTNCLYYAILLHMREKHMVPGLGAAGCISAVLWHFFLRNPMVYERGTMAVWLGAALGFGALLAKEMTMLLQGVKKGEMICYQWS